MANGSRGMRTLLKLFVILLILGGIGAASYWPAMKYWKQRNRPQWRTDQVVRGDILAVVNATGQVKPVLSVQVGAFVSGPIVELPGRVQPGGQGGRLAGTHRSADLPSERGPGRRRSLKIREAEVKRVRGPAEAGPQRRETRRWPCGPEMRTSSPTRNGTNCNSTGCRWKPSSRSPQASVEQAKASLTNAQANLDYTSITSPVDGIVIDRKIDPGQTLAAQFQTPQLFVVAPQMREKMHVHALIDEADIGLIRDAQKRGLSVEFTVDAYLDDLFQGTIEEIRYSSTTTQNVVTYPVIVAAANPDLKLLPGMTASLSFRVDERKQVIRIPNAALRFFPDQQYVREADRKLLEGVGGDSDKEKEKPTEQRISANERAEARRRRTKRHVWVEDGEFLKAVPVEVGLSDSRYTELLSGDVKEGQSLVTGLKAK